MNIQNKDIINEIKKLKLIKADDSFKFSLRTKIFEEAGRSFVTNVKDTRLHNQQTSNLQQIITNLIPGRKNMFISLLLIAALLGGGAGTTYASQSSLPGDVLYPVKIATGKVQTVLTVDDTKEADLHLKFSEKRLGEVDKLAQKGRANPELVKEVIDNYKKELSEAKDILDKVSAVSPDQSIKIARSLDSATTRHKESLVKISGEVEGAGALDALKGAWKEAINHNDIAKIELLKKLAVSDVVDPVLINENVSSNTDTSAVSAVVDGTADSSASNTMQTDQAADAGVAVIQSPELHKMVTNKISEANHKISEAEKYINKKEAKGADASVAKAQIVEARTLIVDAKNLLGQAKYAEAFLKAKEAHQKAQGAKEALENNYKREHQEKEDSDDDENIFILSADSLNNSSTSGEVNKGEAAINNANIQTIRSHEINEKKDDERRQDDESSRTESKEESEHESEDRD